MGHGERHKTNICPRFRACYHLGSTSWVGSGCSSKVLVVPLHQQRAGEQGRAPFRLVLSVLGVETPCLGRVWGKALLCWLPWQAVLSVMLNRSLGENNWGQAQQGGMLPSASWISELCQWPGNCCSGKRVRGCTLPHAQGSFACLLPAVVAQARGHNKVTSHLLKVLIYSLTFGKPVYIERSWVRSIQSPLMWCLQCHHNHTGSKLANTHICGAWESSLRPWCELSILTLGSAPCSTQPTSLPRSRRASPLHTVLLPVSARQKLLNTALTPTGQLTLAGEWASKSP